MHASAGYSLFEIIVVLVIVGILAGLGAYSLSRFGPTNKVKVSVRELDTSLFRLRSMALTGMARPCLGVSDSSAYRLFLDRDANGLFGTGDSLIQAVQLRTPAVFLEATSSKSTGLPVVCFEPRGVSGSASGSFRVKVGLRGGGPSRTLFLLAATGKAEIRH